jgi:thiamine-phosphate pyrophosphorylase
MKIENLQYISQQNNLYSHIQGIREACNCGVKWVQLRIKEGSFEEKLALANQVKAICSEYHATLIINDDPALALGCNAHGVHLGKSDMPINDARNILGTDKIFGGTANTWSDIKQLAIKGANYIGLGPFQFTTTKQNLSPELGLDGYTNMITKCKQLNLQIPIIAIGGITITNIKPLMQTGIQGIAVSGLLANATNMQSVFNQIQAQLNE